ncbi:hypothetical protein QE320_gp041 [Pseudomonas phage EM]|uniref:Uncharacterized protein n=1 Tax=Pseudomonas phage EM TaxID=2936914 RepID=A0AAE9HG07_9CAUD|nr:hypothetical protein QE320_gp041 [Pseudomonas phage EM]UPW35843.1 hypothetical protein EM_041 [Pseudomonas phage EM]
MNDTVKRIDDVIEALQEIRKVHGNLKVVETEHGDLVWSYFDPHIVYLTQTQNHYMEQVDYISECDEVAVHVGGAG